MITLSACYGGSRPPRIGSNAPDFTVEDFTLNQFHGQVLVLNFWATWCAPCVEELPSLVEMQRQMKSKGVTVLAVSVDVDENAYRRFVKDHSVNLLLTGRDPSGKSNRLYGTFMFPETYIIDRSGVLQRKFVGPVDWTEPEIMEFLAQLSVDPKNQNAVPGLKKSTADGAVMEAKVVDQPGFTVVGITARTRNAKEMTADGVIGKLWARFMQEGISGKIPNKVDSSIVAVYTDYASDKNGEYTYLLGCRVTSATGLAAGLEAKKIPGGRFAVFTTEKGPGPKVVPETWMHINSLPKSAPGGDRVYAADFEIYDERAKDPQNLQADVYVGIRK